MTNAPHNRCTSQVSVVVTTPAAVMFARIHAIFGAEKYGSSTRPVRCATVVRRRRQRRADRLGPPVLPHHRGVSGRPVSRSQASTVSPWLASATAATGTSACAKACRPASTTESNSASGSCSTPPPARYSGRTATSAIDTTASGLVDHDGLGARRALVDGQDVLHRQPFSASCSSASIECISGMVKPCLPRVTNM